MLMKTARRLGFTLIELMIGLAIAALLVVLALPGYSAWIADAQMRNGAESIASGLRYAQAEAIKQNATVEFVLNAGGWVVETIDPTTCNPVLPPVRVATFQEGASTAVFAPFDVTGAAGGTRVTFTSLGDRRKSAAGNVQNCDGSEMLALVCIRHAMATGAVCTQDAGAAFARSMSSSSVAPAALSGRETVRASRSATRNGRRPIPKAVRPDHDDDVLA